MQTELKITFDNNKNTIIALGEMQNQIIEFIDALSEFYMSQEPDETDGAHNYSAGFLGLFRDWQIALLSVLTTGDYKFVTEYSLNANSFRQRALEIIRNKHKK